MIRFFIVLFMFSFGLTAAAFDVKSTFREPSVSYKFYAWQARPMVQSLGKIAGRSVLDSAKPYDLKNLAPATEWSSLDELQERFEEVRDLRFLKSDRNIDFLRRISWLYPENGCFARAAMAVKNFKNVWNVPVPSKVFAFGDLSVLTDNDPKGEVTWWYHVAPIVQVEGEYYVLDPSIDPRRPMKLQSWLAVMNPNVTTLEVAICESGSYAPDDSCARVSDGIEEEAMRDQNIYLNYEWRNLIQLNRSPEAELGDSPPWMN